MNNELTREGCAGVRQGTPRKLERSTDEASFSIPRPPSIPLFRERGSHLLQSQAQRRGYSGLLAQVPHPRPPLSGWGRACPIPSLLKGPTRIVALLRKRKFFS